MKVSNLPIGCSIVLSIAVPTDFASAQLPAFPGAQGGAANVSGGRGGIVYHVTKLDRNFSDGVVLTTNDIPDAIGTLRYGLNDANFPAGTPRTIVFDVAGVFWLGRYGAERGHHNGWDTQDRYNVGSNITLAGQAAPGPVLIMGGVTKLGNANVILRNVTFAPGYGMRSFEKPDEDPPVLPTPGDFPDSYVYDALDISGQNIMVDHCTTLYATDETISCDESAANLTIQYCNISQGQNYPQWDAEGGGYTGHALGSLLQAGSNAKISVLNCLYAHQKGRLPRVGSEVGTGALNDFRNNVFYNWFGTAGTGASGQPSFNNFINNFYLAGDGGDDVSDTNIVSSGGGTGIFDGKTSLTRVYRDGNLKDTNKDGDPNDGVDADTSFSSISAQSTAYNIGIGTTLTASDALTNVLKYVGSRWWVRDYDFTQGNTNAISTNDIASYVDERLIHETITGTGKIVAWADDPFDSDPAEGIEWRTLLELRADTNTGAAPFNQPAGWDTDGDGMPDYWEEEHGLDPAVTNNNADFDLDGYTDVEEYLNDIAAWPAPGEILFTGNHNNRYAEIFNWKVTGVSVNISGIGTLPTSSPWQPSQYDTAVISNATVAVDAVGQHAGNLRLSDSGTLNISNGWLKVADTLEIGPSSAATLNLSVGWLRVGTLSRGGSGSFNFTGGTLSADTVNFDLVNGGGIIAPGESVGQTVVNGDLTLQGGSSLAFELGSANTNDSDNIVVNGDLTLGGSLDVSALAGFGTGTYTLIIYTGTLGGSMTLSSAPNGFGYAIDTSSPNEVRLVVSPRLPEFQTVNHTGLNIVLTGVGPTNEMFHLLTSPDPGLPISLWTPVQTNVFDSHGEFIITNDSGVEESQRFYLLHLP